MTTCAAAEKLAREARALDWTAEVRYGRGELGYQQLGDPRGDGTRPKVTVPEPVHSAGVYARRGVHVLAAFYVARDAAERRTKTGALSWALDGALGRRLVRDGWTPTAFEQPKTADGEPPGPTTLAQVGAYLAEHGQAPEVEQPELVQPELELVTTPARPNWGAAA